MQHLVISIFLTIIFHFRVQGYSIVSNDIDFNPLWIGENLFHRNYKKYVKPLRDDPDVDSSTLDMIERAGYPAEAHVITTTDGYMLTVHRIPGKFKSTPVFLQHGLLSSSADWVITGKTKALAYLLADRGYDVWLGNSRGNTYSRAHRTLSTSDPKFWDFSWDEMGKYDLPAVILYISNYKNDSLIYIGHSMGTTMFYVMATNRPEIVGQVKAMISLAPIAYMSHLKSPIRLIAPMAYDIGLITRIFGANEFLPNNSIIKLLAKFGCEFDTLEEKICANSIFAICGFDSAQFNTTLMPVILSHSPAGTSTKTLIHYAQEINSGRFQAYDYGSTKNRQHYNSTSPPDYDISKIRVPIALFVADNDWLASSIDVNVLWSKIPNKIEKFRINFAKFNHVDFLWAVDARKLVYNQVLSVIEKYANHTSMEVNS